MNITKIGIVGSGHIGGNLGILAKAGYEICFSSRHPETLENLVHIAGEKTRFGTPAEAVAFGDVIVLSLPMKALPELDPEVKNALKGKIVIDTSNPYPERDGMIADVAANDGTGAVVARLLPEAKIVRAFNTVYYSDLRKRVNKYGETIGVPIASDDQEGLLVAGEIVKNAGLDPVVVGDLNSSRMFDVGTSVYATSDSAGEIRRKLKLRPDISRMAA